MGIKKHIVKIGADLPDFIFAVVLFSLIGIPVLLALFALEYGLYQLWGFKMASVINGGFLLLSLFTYGIDKFHKWAKKEQEKIELEEYRSAAVEPPAIELERFNLSEEFLRSTELQRAQNRIEELREYGVPLNNPNLETTHSLITLANPNAEVKNAYVHHEMGSEEHCKRLRKRLDDIKKTNKEMEEEMEKLEKKAKDTNAIDSLEIT